MQAPHRQAPIGESMPAGTKQKQAQDSVDKCPNQGVFVMTPTHRQARSMPAGAKHLQIEDTGDKCLLQRGFLTTATLRQATAIQDTGLRHYPCCKIAICPDKGKLDRPGCRRESSF